MKVAAATTLLFATLALANPAPAAEPNSIQALSERSSAAAPKYPSYNPALAARDPKKKKSKPKSSNKGNGTQEEESAARVLSPSRVVELGAIGVGVMEIVRLWG